MNYTSYYDAKALEYAAADAIEEHVAAWEQDYNVGNIEVVYVEMVKIQGYNVPGDRVVDL